MMQNIYWISVLGYAIISLIILIKERKSGDRLGKPGYAFLGLIHSSLLFYVADFMWGLCLQGVIHSETVYFWASTFFHLFGVSVAVAWLFYVLRYVGCRRRFRTVLMSIACAVGAVEVGLGVRNFFEPTLFSITDGVYSRECYAMFSFVSQYIIFSMAAIVTFISLMMGIVRKENRIRYWAVLFAATIPLSLGVIQLRYLDAPYFSMGYMLSTLVLYIFVVTGDREDLYHSKAQFLRNMSHEIRTSLNSVYGFAQLLGMPDGTWKNEEREKYNEYIFNNYNMLDLLLNDLIAYAKSDKIKYAVHEEKVKVVDACDSVMQSFQFCKPETLSLNLVSQVDNNYTIKSDATRIQQILLHMLANGVQYTESGSLDVEINEVEKGIEIAVVDNTKTMPGMRPQPKHLQGTRHDRATRNLGLRIHLCQQVARLLGGRVYLDTHYDKGVRIAFFLKAKRVKQ